MKNKRKLLVVAMAGCLTLSANSAFSLGLGPVEVHSALGQPFHASIPFTSTLAEKVTPNDISARLASRDEHARQGLPYPHMPRLEMTVNQDESGQTVIQMKDSFPAAEPIVNMIVEVIWPGGRIFRTVTLLLDPPEYVAPKAPREIIVHADKSVRRSSSKLKVVKQVDGNDGKSTPRVRDGKYIDVRSGDTLSEIAFQVYRQHDVDVITMMQVLFEHNPHAFGRTMHQLKAGVTLEIPQGEKFKEYVEAEPAAPAAKPVVAAPVAEPVADTVLAVEEASGVSVTVANDIDPVASAADAHTEVTGGTEQKTGLVKPEQALSQTTVADTVEESLLNQQVDTAMLKLRLNNQQLQDDLITLGQELKASNNKISELQQTNQQLTTRLNELTEALQQADLIAENGANQNTGWLAMLAALLASVIAGIMSVLWWRERSQGARQVTLPVSNELTDFSLSLDTDETISRTDQYAGSANPYMDTQDASKSDSSAVTAEVMASVEEREANQEEALRDEMEDHNLNDTRVEVQDINPGDACFQDTEIRRIIFSSDGNEESKLLMLTILEETGKEQEFKEMLEKLLVQYPDRDSEMHQKVLLIAKQSPFAFAGDDTAAEADEEETAIPDEVIAEPDVLSDLDALLASHDSEATDETVMDASPAETADANDKTMVFEFSDVDEFTSVENSATEAASSLGTVAMDMNAESDDENMLEADFDNDATELFIELDNADHKEPAVEELSMDIDVLNRQELIQQEARAKEVEATEVLDLGELNLDSSEDRDYAPGLPDLELLDEDEHDDMKKQAAGK